MAHKWQDYLPFAMVVILLIIMVLGLYGVFTIPSGEEPDQPCTFPEFVCGFGIAIGIPEGWLRSDTIIWYMLIPIAGIWMIIYGFLDRINIFREAISAVLAFLIAFSMIPLGIFVLIVSLIFSFIGIYSVILFFALFIIGTVLYSRGMYGAWRDVWDVYKKQVREYDKLLVNLYGRERELRRKLERAKNKKREFAGIGEEKIQRTIKEVIAPDLQDIRKQIREIEARKRFAKEQRSRTAKTFKLREKI